MDESRIRPGLPVRLSAYHSHRLRKKFPDRHKAHKHVFGVVISLYELEDLIRIRTSGGVYSTVYADEVFEVRKRG